MADSGVPDYRPDFQYIEEGLVNIARRRLLTAPDVLYRFDQSHAGYPGIFGHIDENVVLLAATSARDIDLHNSFKERYGTPFPGLYSLHGVAPEGDRGALPIREPDNFIYWRPGGITVESSVVFDLFPDTRLAAEHLRIIAPMHDGSIAEYRPYVILMVCFGREITILDAVQEMNDLAGQYVHFSRLAAENHRSAADH